MDYLFIGVCYLVAGLSLVLHWFTIRKLKEIRRQFPKRSKYPMVMVLCHVCRGQRFDADGRLCKLCGGDGCILKEKRDRGITKLIADLRLKPHQKP